MSKTIAQLNSEVQASFLNNDAKHKSLRKLQVERQVKQGDLLMRMALSKRLIGYV